MGTGVDPSSEEDDGDVEFDDSIQCSWKYVIVCFVMPALDGCINGFFWSGYSLYFQEMNWPIVRAGMSISGGFVVRVCAQMLQLRAGYWLSVPISMVHLAVVIVALIFTTSEWAIIMQLVALIGFDPTCAIEGIAFDAFGDSEVQARQATSTVLSIYTIAVATSCSAGGVIYDFFSWKAVFFSSKEVETKVTTIAVKSSENQPSGPEETFMWVMPSAASEVPALPGAVDLSYSSGAPFEEKNARERFDTEQSQSSGSIPGIRERFDTEQSRGSIPALRDRLGTEPSQISEIPEDAQVGGHTPGVRETFGDEQPQGPGKVPGTVQTLPISSAPGGRGSQVSIPGNQLPGHGGSRASRASRASRSSRASYASHASARFRGRHSQASKMSRMSKMSKMSSMTSLTEAGQEFRHHIATSSALQPVIVGATPGTGVIRDEVIGFDDNGHSIEQTSLKRKGVPKDLRLPAFLIPLNLLCNTMCYNLEFGTFAMFFKEVHGWNEATWASLAQTAGDVVAAIVMQIVPRLPINCCQEPDELNCVFRFFYYVVSQPYNLTCILISWVILNLGMMSPVLALAIIAQVFMGTCFVYSSKMSTELNLFYSLGDPEVFLALQVNSRNAEAFGGCMAGTIATVLYTVDPVAPFLLGAAMAGVVFVAYTAGFCARLGFGEDIENAEAKRARRKGLRRVSSWKSEVRKSVLPSVVPEE